MNYEPEVIITDNKSPLPDKERGDSQNRLAFNYQFTPNN